MPQEHPERTLHRWQGYDYASKGAYYLTICTHHRLQLFGCIKAQKMFPTPLGELVRECWETIPQHRTHLDVGEFIVMPNHFHGIVIIRERLVRADGTTAVGSRHGVTLRDPRKPPGIPHGALGQIVSTFKSSVTRIAYRDGLLPQGTPVWQRNYWDRVIRDADEHDRIAQYIAENPENWKGDRFNG